MHIRLKARRERVAQRVEAKREATLRQLMALVDALERQVEEVRIKCPDPRLITTADTIRSARLLVSLMFDGGTRETEYLPCVIAALIHVKGVILDVADSLRAHAMADASAR